MLHHDIATLQRLRELPKVLAREIKGQAHALPEIIAALQQGELGLTKPGRPRSSLLLLGPTGVGKTETATIATEHLFGLESLFRLDMSEYQVQESVGQLLGTQPEIPGRLEAIRQSAERGSLLFDEVEKAHPRVLDLLLQLLDAARITVSSGKTLDFSGYHLWLTTNVGAGEILHLEHSSSATLERMVLAKAQSAFRPEIFARIQRKIVFQRLSYDVQVEIAEKLLGQQLTYLRGQGLTLSMAPDLLPYLVRIGYHPKLGARLLRNAVEGFVGEQVARQLLQDPGAAERPISLAPPRAAHA